MPVSSPRLNASLRSPPDMPGTHVTCSLKHSTYSSTDLSGPHINNVIANASGTIPDPAANAGRVSSASLRIAVIIFKFISPIDSYCE